MSRLFCAFFLCLLLPAVQAEDLPKVDLGIGFAAQHLRDYRGADESQTQALPFPILIYRGDRFQADKDGIRGLFLEGEGWELNFSAEAALNGGSDENTVRAGMESLDSAVEFGPSLNFNLTGEDFDHGWSLRLPLRAVFAVDLTDKNIEPIGFNANPKITYRKPALWRGWNSKVDLGLLWGSDDYHDYYYSVAPAMVTAERTAYDAAAGYSGSYFKFSLKKRRGQLWYGWNLRYDNLSAAVFDDSPLAVTPHYFSTTLAVGWFFWSSD